MSSAVDDDVARTVAEGRQQLGTMLRTAQKHLQKVFMVFLVGFLGTFTVLRLYIWDILKRDLNAHPDIVVVAITPFEVILLQAKIGLASGVVIMLPALLYFARDSLRERGWWPRGVPRWKIAGFVLVSAALFVAGIAYAYRLFFPLMFSFLAGNAVGAGFQPTYSISMWAQFIFLLSLSFGLAAQLPLAMSTLAYSGIVQYETFRDKWKYAVIAIFAFGALFSPPDPFTQIMWAIPLVTLYGASLYLTKIVVTAKRSSDDIDVPGTALERWNVLAGVFVVVLAGIYAFYTYGVYERINDGLVLLGSSYRFLPAGAGYGVSGTAHIAAFGVLYGLGAAAVVLGYFVYDGLEEPDDTFASPGGTQGNPADIDISQLDAAGVRAAPSLAFAKMDESEALALASEAMEADNPEKAQLILDRYDDTNPPEAEASPSDFEDGEATAATEGEAAEADDADEEAGLLARRGAGILGAFSEDDIDEDDIGGYAYDVAFIFDSLTSKSFRLVAVFMLVMAGAFAVLYRGGIAVLHRQFVSGMPSEFAAEQVSIVTLHPVEALIFMIKVSVVLGAVATVPLVLYYAWPALKERGFARGDRRFLLAWGGSLLGATVVGGVVGFAYLAPAVISWLAADVLRADMIIAYRIKNYGWMIFFLTAGIGLLSMIPVSMFLFHRGGIVPFRTMRGRWREFTIAVFALSSFLSPGGVFTMFMLALPVVFTYLLGLGVLWLYTLGGRRAPGPAEPAD